MLAVEAPSRPNRDQVITVLLVDDQFEFRELARALLSSHPEISLVGEAGGPEEAMALLPVLEPRAVILDVQLSGANGFELAWRMLDARPGLRALVISAYDYQYDALARAVGAVGFLHKKRFSAEAVMRLLKVNREV